jgi:hypothetical protein
MFGGDKTWVLDLAAIPQILQQPMPAIAASGDTAVFGVSADGPGVLGFQWFKDGLQLRDGFGIDGAHTSTLTLTNVTVSDSGDFDVQVSNSCGSLASNVVQLVVLSPGDVTADGLVNIDDLVAVITAWGPCSARCPADTNDDGVVNIDDLVLVITHWG